MLEHARKATGMQDFSGTDSLWNLTPEQMKARRSDVWLWDIMESSGKGGYGERVTDKLDDYIPEGWTDDFLGVDADHQVELSLIHILQ